MREPVISIHYHAINQTRLFNAMQTLYETILTDMDDENVGITITKRTLVIDIYNEDCAKKLGDNIFNTILGKMEI